MTPRMWIALPAAAIYAAYLVVLRRQTRRNRAATTQGDTVFVVQMTERVRDRL